MRTNLAPALALVVAALALPSAARADYLYSAFREAATDPYVMFVLDTSGSMDHDREGRPATDATVAGGKTVCPYGSKAGTEECNCRTECVEWRWRHGEKYCRRTQRVCDSCVTEACKTRADAATEVLTRLIGELDGGELGLIHFENAQASDCSTKACARKWVASPGQGDTREAMLAAIASARFDSNTPIALSLKDARARLQAVGDADPSAGCRGYFVILLTDGEDTCCGDPAARAAELRSVSTKNGTLDIRTFVLGFGRDVAGSDDLSAIARAGGTARVDSRWECWNPTGTATGVASTCTKGSALFAGDTATLEAALEEVVGAIRSGFFTGMAPVIGTVAQARSESDRVARNLMAYTAFSMPGYQGHLFGIRLFAEKRSGGKSTGEWSFTDFRELDLEACGSAGNPCLFDAGRRLRDRVRSNTAAERRIWTSRIDEVAYQDADGKVTTATDLGVRLAPSRTPLWITRDSGGAEALRTAAASIAGSSPFGELLADRASLAAIDLEYPDRLDGLLSTDDMFRGTIVAWLHGDPAIRPWPLGDPYHGGATIVETPPYAYKTRGYPRFRDHLATRPPMIYVPANDGMIHAFHAGPDLESMRKAGRENPTCTSPERWCAGDEAWAHLPVNLLARTAVEVLGGAERFFSMDLSCRVDDVLVHDNRGASGYDCSADPHDPELCGWRTVLLCGQGWGGNWYVALDVSDPLEPHPLWELTFDEGAKGFGRTWSLPGLALLQLDGFPRWVAIGGSGYNTDLKAHGGTSHRAYRLLNLPFAGTFAHHGDGTAGDDGRLYLWDVATGKMIKRIDASLGAVVADVPAVDVDRDGFSETAYAAGWNGEIHRVAFGGEDGAREAAPVKDWSYCTNLFEFGGNHPVPNRPVLMADPSAVERLYLIAASGRDKGSFPDDARNEPASYDLDGWFFDDSGGVSCSSHDAPNGNGNMCKDSSGLRMNGLFNQGQGKRRLMGAPIISGQFNGDRWLSFTTWDPPRSSCGGDGVGSLYCVKWSTDPSSCGYCGDLDDDGAVNADDESILISTEIPPPPISADGQIYVTTEDGVQRVANQDGEGPGIDGSVNRANSLAPWNELTSWREVFEAAPVAAEP